jgi:hypothetical protein
MPGIIRKVGRKMDDPKSGSRDCFELRIFFALQVVIGIEDFTILVRCGAVKSRATGMTEQEPFR